MIVPAPGDEHPKPAVGASLAGWGVGRRGAGSVWVGRVLLVAPSDLGLEGCWTPSRDVPARTARSRLGPFNRGE